VKHVVNVKLRLVALPGSLLDKEEDDANERGLGGMAND
jgi:hypothetical protein